MTDLRQAYIFVVATLLLSWGFEALLILRGGVRSFGLLWLVGLMCIPGVVAIAVRLILRSGFADAGFRLGPRRYYLYAIGLPLLLAMLVGAIAAVTDIRRIAMLTPAALMQMVTIGLTILCLGIVGALGEEIGWRGLLLPKLVNGGARYPYAVTGLIWALWHLPLIAFGGFYETGRPMLMATVYGIGILVWNTVISELRMRSGSVWVAALAHAAHNFFFQFGVPALILTVPGSQGAWWDVLCSDTGLSVAVLYACAYGVLRSFGRRRSAEMQPA